MLTRILNNEYIKAFNMGFKHVFKYYIDILFILINEVPKDSSLTIFNKILFCIPLITQVYNFILYYYMYLDYMSSGFVESYKMCFYNNRYMFLINIIMYFIYTIGPKLNIPYFSNLENWNTYSVSKVISLRQRKEEEIRNLKLKEELIVRTRKYYNDLIQITSLDDQVSILLTRQVILTNLQGFEYIIDEVDFNHFIMELLFFKYNKKLKTYRCEFNDIKRFTKCNEKITNHIQNMNERLNTLYKNTPLCHDVIYHCIAEY